MKKVICLILALIATTCLTACDDDVTATTQASSADASSVQSNIPSDSTQSTHTSVETQSQASTPSNTYTFTYGSTTIAMNADASSVLATLGEPKSYTEEESCAFEGLSKTYYFGSFYLETYPDGSTDRIYCVWLVDDSVTTEEGIYIGSSQEQVENTYGTQCYNGRNAYVIESDDCILTIIIENNVVNSIQYTAVTQ